MITEDKKILTFEDLFLKILNYWYLVIISIFSIVIATIYLEKNKIEINIAELTISPLSIVEFDNDLLGINYNDSNNNLTITRNYSNIDNFYMMTYSPLSVLFAYSEKIKKILFSEYFEEEKYKDIKNNIKVYLEDNNSQTNLRIRLKSEKNKEEIKKETITLIYMK